jgi:CheY-like chemotaxis protein
MKDRQGARVLVVDDDADLIESYRGLLESSGYTVSTAQTGEAALGLAHVDRPDVVLTDVSMPSMDGFELIHRLKDELGAEAPPVIVVSAFEITEWEAMAQGAELFLEKPASPEALIHAIEVLRRGERPDPETLASERTNVMHERLRSRKGSELRLRDVDRGEVARETKPWLEWLRRYFDCASAGVFLLDGGAVLPVVVEGREMTARPEPRLLHATLAAGVETGTSLVIADMATHPAFRRALGARTDIASFAGVPLVTTDGIRVGALCIADAQPGRFDADSLSLLEYLGRRGVSVLLEKRLGSGQTAPPGQAPLLARRTFETLLAGELRVARRTEMALEVAVMTLAKGVTQSACAEDLWHSAARPHMAVGSMGPGQVGIFVRGPAEKAREHVAFCLETARAHKLLDAAGVAAVVSTAELSTGAVVELAENALSAAHATTFGSRLERIVVRSDPSRPMA